MIGTLLDDIVAGLSFDSVSRRFAEKMHPLQYQRPQAEPTAGNIARAEKIIEELGLQKSLERRFARVEELEKIWIPQNTPGTKANVKGGVFSHLTPKSKSKPSKMELPQITMTWSKFKKTVLPLAQGIEYLVGNKKESYAAILTALHKDAPPILQWDSEERRNPFSQYIYIGGSLYSNWGLSIGFCKVAAICYTPSMWHKSYSHQSKAVFFILEGAKDKQYKNAGNALFPENLRAELREIRATIEAYSKAAVIESYNEASACGIKLEYSSNWDAVFRVATDTGIVTYKLDRWD